MSTSQMVLTTYLCNNSHIKVQTQLLWVMDEDLQTQETLLQGSSEAGLYPIHLQHLRSTKASPTPNQHLPPLFTVLLGVKAPIQVWHSRLGHPFESVLQQLVLQSVLLVVRLDFINSVNLVKWPRVTNFLLQSPITGLFIL